MIKYVCVYAQPIGARPQNAVVLIRRAKSDWQHGMLNLPGGKREEGELSEAAAVRELREETGLHGMLGDSRVLGKLHCSGCEVSFVYVPYHVKLNNVVQEPRTMSAEGEIVTYDLRTALTDETLIPNLKIIIPLCHARVGGWRMLPSDPMNGRPDANGWIIDFQHRL